MSVEKTINEYIRRAKRLKQELHYEPFPITSVYDAQRFIEMHAEYRFLTQMFSDMQLFRWSDEDFEYKEK